MKKQSKKALVARAVKAAKTRRLNANKKLVAPINKNLAKMSADGVFDRIIGNMTRAAKAAHTRKNRVKARVTANDINNLTKELSGLMVQYNERVVSLTKRVQANLPKEARIEADAVAQLSQDIEAKKLSLSAKKAWYARQNKTQKAG